MDLQRIKDLINLVETTGITGLSIEEGELKLEIKKQAEQIVYSGSAALAAATPNATATKSATPADEHHGLTAIKSPMTGTFYAAPSPDSPAFVQIGTQIKTGQPVCIVEAMKTFNQIDSEVSGTIEKILVKNQQPVDFGQVLMLVRE